LTSQQVGGHAVGVGVGVGVAVGVGVGVGVGPEGQKVLSSHFEAFDFKTSSTLLILAHKISLSLVIVPILC
jgi:hypothetical protein